MNREDFIKTLKTTYEITIKQVPTQNQYVIEFNCSTSTYEVTMEWPSNNLTNGDDDDSSCTLL